MSDNAPFTGRLIIKRLADILFSTLGLAVLLPVLVVTAIIVKAGSPGPVLFRQKRLGRHGTVFSIFKFRTMTDGATTSAAGLVTFEGDPRITRAGKILRMLHIDELPQLLNILRGEMSFVGPRPTMPFHYDYYADWEKERLRLCPGLTGWSQINGGATVNWDRRIELDVWYVRNFSLFLDCRILLLTAWMIVRRMLRRESTQSQRDQLTWTRGIPSDPYSNSVSRRTE